MGPAIPSFDCIGSGIPNSDLITSGIPESDPMVSGIPNPELEVSGESATLQDAAVERFRVGFSKIRM